jgi:hypothetical protein
MGDVVGFGKKCPKCGEYYPDGANPDGLGFHACDATPTINPGVPPAHPLDLVANEILELGLTALRISPTVPDAAHLLTAVAAYRKASLVDGDIDGALAGAWADATPEEAGDGVVEPD